MRNDSNNIVNLKACRSIKELALTAHETIGALEKALYDILDTGNLQEVKEIAADALEEDLEVYLEEDDLSELDFEGDIFLLDEDDSMLLDFNNEDKY